MRQGHQPRPIVTELVSALLAILWRTGGAGWATRTGRIKHGLSTETREATDVSERSARVRVDAIPEEKDAFLDWSAVRHASGTRTTRGDARRGNAQSGVASWWTNCERSGVGASATSRRSSERVPGLMWPSSRTRRSCSGSGEDGEGMLPVYVPVRKLSWDLPPFHSPSPCFLLPFEF